MKKCSALIMLLLAFMLSTSAFAITYNSIESTHGTHANPGKTVYTYSLDGKEITETKDEVINVCPMTKYSDLKAVNWSHEGIDFVLSHGYMNGTSETRFEPDGSMTRAMVVTVLYRAGQNIGIDTSASGKLPFADVQNGKWYTDAIKWAYKNDIAKGVSDKSFSPNTSVTREQITLFISRFAKFIGDDVSKGGSISKFSDVLKLSAESKSAISWAVGNGILKGYENGKIGPKDTATRAQFAAMLQRWMDGRCTSHDYVLSKTLEASCTSDGANYYVCKNCSAEKYIKVPACGHNFGDKKIKKAASCTEDGSYERVCKNCGDKITGKVSATGHKYGDKVTVQEPGCTKDGAYEQICTKCGHRVSGSIPATDHKYGLKEVTKAPTCTEDGTYEQVCVNCGNKLSGKIPAVGHSYGEKQLDKAASCTEVGTYVKVCKDCGDTVVVDTIPAKGHNYTEKITKEPSCAETGEKEKTCSECEDIVTAVIPMTAHSYSNGVCTACGKFEHSAVKTESIDDGDKVIIVNPSALLSIGQDENSGALNSVPVCLNANEISIEEGCAVFSVEKTADGLYFKNSDGKYLTCNVGDDGCKLCFCEDKSDNALWTVSSGTIINENVKYNGNAQCIACRKSSFQCIDYCTKNDICIMNFYKVE